MLKMLTLLVTQTTAETLAAILMLENATLPSSLSILLDARSKSLSAILDRPRTRKASQEVDALLCDLAQLLGLVLRTVEAATDIFGVDGPDQDGLLLNLLKAVESPSAAAEFAGGISLQPILARLPNHSLLQKHLPSSILDFTPFLSLDSPRHALPSSAAQAEIQAWLETETARVIGEIESWLVTLHGGARTLAQVRQAVRTSLAAGGPPAEQLQSRLDSVIETRLAAIYQAHFNKLVDRVEPCVVSLLEDLPHSAADLDTAEFLFDSPLAFPSSAQHLAPAKAGHKMVDPFHSFLDKVVKRVEGRSPLADRGLSELEAHARDLRTDLEGWLAVEGEDHAGPGSR